MHPYQVNDAVARVHMHDRDVSQAPPLSPMDHSEKAKVYISN